VYWILGFDRVIELFELNFFLKKQNDIILVKIKINGLQPGF
jgi:hypothetical protein